jgi:flagellar FliJ protein
VEKKFKFKLDGLLKLREFKEKRLKVELGQILQDIQSVNVKINGMKENITETYEAQERVMHDGSDGNLLRFFPEFIQTKRDDIKNHENLIYALEKQYERKVQEMKLAMGETKVIENLKDKKKTEHKKKVDKKSLEEIEELLMMGKLSRQKSL